MELVGGQDVSRQGIEQRLQQCRRTADHAREGRAFELDAFARIDPALAVEREVVGVLAHQHMCQQPRANQAAGDRTAGRTRLDDGLALRA
jgi:hypothetical protein